MKNFLEFSYDELEKLNLEAKAKAASGTVSVWFDTVSKLL